MLRTLAFLLPLPWVNSLKYNSMVWVHFTGILLLFVSEFAYILLHYLLQRTLGLCFPYFQALRFSQLRDTARPFETRLEYTSGRKFCITENGYMGWYQRLQSLAISCSLSREAEFCLSSIRTNRITDCWEMRISIV